MLITALNIPLCFIYKVKELLVKKNIHRIGEIIKEEYYCTIY